MVGLRFEDNSAHLCEVATHLGGLEYGRGYENSAERISRKFSRARAYAAESLQSFPNVTFSFWAPRVPKGKLLGLLTEIEGLRLVINEDYTARVEVLRKIAASTRKDTGNPFFRSMQLLEHLRR